MPEPVTVPDVVAPPPKHPRFPMIDGARAIAVGTIVVFHAAVFGNAVSSSVPGRLQRVYIVEAVAAAEVPTPPESLARPDACG